MTWNVFYIGFSIRFHIAALDYSFVNGNSSFTSEVCRVEYYFFNFNTDFLNFLFAGWSQNQDYNNWIRVFDSVTSNTNKFMLVWGLDDLSYLMISSSIFEWFTSIPNPWYTSNTTTILCVSSAEWPNMTTSSAVRKWFLTNQSQSLGPISVKNFQ